MFFFRTHQMVCSSCRHTTPAPDISEMLVVRASVRVTSCLSSCVRVSVCV